MFKKLKSYVEKCSDRYLRSTRGAVLLIIIPAYFIVTIYFYNIATEIFIKKHHQPAIDYELRLAPLKKDLPRDAVFNYVSDRSYMAEDFVLMRYTLVPARPVRGLQPRQDYLVA